MSEQEEFFSPKHKQLLSIATWAKYLAWVVLILAIINAGLIILQKQNYFEQTQVPSGTYQDYWDMVRQEPIYYLSDLGSDLVTVLLRGIVLYLILKGISLGIMMIVGTDINYREIKPTQETPSPKDIDIERESKAAIESTTDEWEDKLLDDDNQPDFYDTAEVLELKDNINTVAKAVVVVNIILGVLSLQYLRILPLDDSLSFQEIEEALWGLFINILVVGLEIVVTYYPLKALIQILRILMEMEFNSRKVK
jgi:hypothetical protein